MKVPELQVQEHNEIAIQYTPFLEAIVENAKTAQAIREEFEKAGTDDDKLALSADAKKCRLSLRSQRTALDKVRKELKEEAKRYTDAVDGNAKKIREYSEAGEADMKAIEDYVLEIEYRRKKALHNERVEQIKVIGGENLLYRYPNGLGEFTPEQFDIVLEDIHSLLEAERLKQAEQARLADIEANKATIRNMRKSQLATVGYSHDGDEADLSEVEFMQLLKDATEAKRLADEKAESDRKEQQRIEEEARVKAEQERIEREKQREIERKQAEVERIEQEKQLAIAQAEAKRLADIEAKRLAEEKAEAQRLEAIKSASDADKFKALVDKAKELAIYAEGFEMDSEKGKDYLAWFTNNINTLSAKAYEAYNKLR